MNEATTPCTVQGCNAGGRRVKGWCDMHYARARMNGGDPGPANLLHRRRDSASCSVDGCELVALAKDLCRKHYERMRAHGNTDGSAIKRTAAHSPGKVYVASSPWIPDLVKVGFSADPEGRVKAMRTGCPGMAVAFVWDTEDMLISERAAHLRLAEYHVEGEWFSCSVDMAAAALASG